MLAKTALVIGATGDIGKVIAQSLSNAGYNLLLCGNKGEFETKKLKTETSFLRFDIRNPEQVKSAFEKLPKLNLVVCCAGIAGEEKLIIDQSDEEILNLVQTNLLGTIYVNKYVLPYINRGGCIVNIASFLGVYGCSCEAVYSATKAGVIGLTKSLSKEFESFAVRVNSISPGYIQTKMNAEFSDEEKRSIIDKTPVGRLGTAEDVAKAVLFLADNDFVNGENIMVDGGLII